MLPLLLACHDPVPHDSKPPPVDDSAPVDSATDTDSTVPVDTHTTDTHESVPVETGDSVPTDPGPQPALVFDGDAPHNLLVISLDTTRHDQIGYFSGLDTTPNLDAVMEQGVVLMDHRTCSNWTAPSTMCVQLGQSPVEMGFFPTSVYHSGSPDPLVPWPPETMPTLSLALQDAGMTTLFVTANGVFSTNMEGVTTGFDTVEELLWQPAPNIVTRVERDLRILVRDGDPWYTHAHFIDPHGPYVAPEEYDTESDALPPIRWDLNNASDAYAAMGRWNSMSAEEQALLREHLLAVYHAELRYWDASFGDLWNALDTMGALDDTLVVFWTDHGEQFGEHGRFQHGMSLHAEENRSTAFFWAKNLRPMEWMGPTIHQDIAPTILQALGVAPSPDHTGVVVGLAPDDRTLFQFNYLVGYSDPVVAVTRSGERLLYGWDGSKSFYDVAVDPEETTDLYDAADPRVIDAWTLLLPEVERIEAQWPHLVPVTPGP